MSLESYSVVVVGGGAAGFFSALAIAEALPNASVTIIEKTKQLLAKVRISGGGRCNVTHHCFDPSLLVKNYPRGQKELRGPFTRFQPADTVEWFKKRGVELKVEEDGRMFPTTDDSETIIRCFLKEASRLGVKVLLNHGLESIEKKEDGQFLLGLQNKETLTANAVVIATGSAKPVFDLLETLRHKIIKPVPSLFTFNVPDSPLLELLGVSVEDAEVCLPDLNYKQRGPLLLTHWGFSGPAVLKLSAWGARDLFNVDYRTPVEINWVPLLSETDLLEIFESNKKRFPQKTLCNEPLEGISKQLWKRLLEIIEIPATLCWADCSKKTWQQIAQQMRKMRFQINGKTTYKQEFVTSGGVATEEVDFKTMQSKKMDNLFFAGEVLNIDGVTGGFNFQNAWTSGWIAAQSIVERVK